MIAALLPPLGSSVAAPTVAEVQRLAPSTAGELLLRGHPHGPIVSVAQLPPQPGPPGPVEFQLLEAPAAAHGGCTRRSWTAQFAAASGTGAQNAVFQQAYPVDEVGLMGPECCAAAHYVLVRQRLDPMRALQMLRTFTAITSGTLKASFSCRTVPHDDLCASEETMRRALAETPPWVVQASGASAEFWLKRNSATVTIVRFEGDQPGRVSLERKYPAPF